MHACVRARVCVCACACVRVCVCAAGGGVAIRDNTTALTVDRVAVTDIGGHGVTGLGNAHPTSVTGLTVSNSTLSHLGFVYLGQSCCVSVVGTAARVLHNECFDTPYGGIMVHVPGGPVPPAGTPPAPGPPNMEVGGVRERGVGLRGWEWGWWRGTPVCARLCV
jgi:hypothetical protein